MSLACTSSAQDMPELRLCTCPGPGCAWLVHSGTRYFSNGAGWLARAMRRKPLRGSSRVIERTRTAERPEPW